MLSGAGATVKTEALHDCIRRPLVSESRVRRHLRTLRRLGGGKVLQSRVERCLKPICSLRQLVDHVDCGSTGPESLITFTSSLRVLPCVGRILGRFGAPLLRGVCRSVSSLRSIASLVGHTVIRSPPLTRGSKNVVGRNCGRSMSGFHHSEASNGG